MVPRHSIVDLSCSGRRLQPLPQYSSTFTVLHLLSQPCGITVFLCFCRDFVWIRKLIYSFKQSAPFLSVRDRLSFCVQPAGSGHFRDLSQATCNIQISNTFNQACKGILSPQKKVKNIAVHNRRMLDFPAPWCYIYVN